MPVSVAMYDKSLEHIGPRLDALGLDLDICTFNKDGRFLIDGADVDPSDVSVDYLWLSAHINAGGARDGVFDTVLACKSIGLLQTFNAGLDHPFYKKVSDKGVPICNSSAQGVAISEYVMAQVMSLIHPIDHQRQLQADRDWQTTPFPELSKTHWMIIGYGPIGQAVAARVKPFGAEITVVRRSATDTENADRVGTMANLDAYLPDADVVVLACPLNETTRGFADASFFAAVNKGAILVNIARGPLIDDAALIQALDTGRLSSAVLDVFHKEPLPTDDPLWTHPKVRMTCHTSFSGDGVQGRWDQLFLDNIVRYVNNEPLIHPVDPANIV